MVECWFVIHSEPDEVGNFHEGNGTLNKEKGGWKADVSIDAEYCM